MTNADSAAVEAVRNVRWVLAICWVTIIFDGYDLIVYGAVLPRLLQYTPWGLTAAEAGQIGSLALVGMLVGALTVGTITDIFGRRKIMIFCLVWFSVAMPLTALAPTPEVFGLLRFVTGLGLGGVVPTAVALTIEYSPARRRQLNNALMFCGYSVGGVLASLLALVILPAFGFRVMFLIGIAPLVLVVPLAYRYLPESISFLTAKGRSAEARRYAERFGISLPAASPTASDDPPARRFGSVAMLFSRRYVVATVLFWMTSTIGLLLVFGLNTWLPEIMRRSGYSLGSALTFLLAFNVGAVVGVIAAAAIADRIGERIVICAAFLIAAAAVLLFILRPSPGPLLMLMAVAGFGANTQTLVNAFVGGYYPATARATALGWALAIGRLGGVLGPVYGGLVLTWVQEGTLGHRWSFYAFAAPALVAVVIVALIPRRARAVEATVAATPGHPSAEAPHDSHLVPLGLPDPTTGPVNPGRKIGPR